MNPSAGGTEDGALASALQILRSGADVEVVAPDGADQRRAAVAHAAGRGIVVLGGDGSIHACVQALADGGLLDPAAPLGIVPLGTGNDLARTLRLPLNPADAARVAIDGVPRPLELLVDDAGHVVVNAVHAGVGAEATARAGAVKGLLGTIGYAVGALRAGVSARGWHLRVTVDGDVLRDGSERLLMVAAGLGATIGGGTPIAPRAEPGDGTVDVVVVGATGPAARTRFALDLRRGRHARRSDVLVVRGREIVVEARDEENAFRVNADGEVGEPVLRRSWTIRPHAWSCRVPAESAPLP